MLARRSGHVTGVTLQHAALEVRREDAAAEVRFWAVVGFAEVAPPGSLARRSAWVQREGAQIHLTFTETPTVPPGGHVAVDLGDAYDATTERLLSAGFSPEPREQHWGAPRAFVRSPAGHRVELMARAPK